MRPIFELTRTRVETWRRWARRDLWISPSGAGRRAHRRDIATRRHGARKTARARAEKDALVVRARRDAIEGFGVEREGDECDDAFAAAWIL